MLRIGKAWPRCWTAKSFRERPVSLRRSLQSRRACSSGSTMNVVRRTFLWSCPLSGPLISLCKRWDFGRNCNVRASSGPRKNAFGGTPDAALIHQYVQHRNHVCRLCVKSHTVHCGWILCTDDFPFCTTKSCLVSRVQWGQHGQQLRVRLEIGYLQPGEFEALTADSLEKPSGSQVSQFLDVPPNVRLLA